jgi:hypothetical protein
MGRKARPVDLLIAGHAVTENRFGRGCPATLVFGDRYDAEVGIEDAITLRRGGVERVLTGSRPGVTHDIRGLGPLLEVFGRVVRDAAGLPDGTLRVGFEGGLVLSVVSSTGYEAWHFQSPRLRLHGAHGHLMIVAPSSRA